MTTSPERYTDAEREFFAQWAETRARHRPAECHYAESGCWVTEGPPAAKRKNTMTRCISCGGAPALRGRP